MKSAVTSIIMFVVVLSNAEAGKSPKPQRDCNAGNFFKKSCNYCWCTVSGIKAGAWCTDFKCKKGDRDRRGVLGERPVLKLAPAYTGVVHVRCTPGDSFRRDCNYCLCLEGGEDAICSLNTCAKDGIGYRKDSCERGETWKEDCNRCFCPSSGIRSEALCTKIACTKDIKVRMFPTNLKELNQMTTSLLRGSEDELEEEDSDSEEELPDNITDELEDDSEDLSEEDLELKGFSRLTTKNHVFENKTHCTPGSDFYLGCNPCSCQSSGIKRGSRCDNRGCPPFPALYDLSAKCAPGSRFKMDCNSCICGTQGTVRGSGCTKKRCHHKHP